jgi:hypothetical protein
MLKTHATCPKCGEVFDLPDEERRRRIACPECHTHFRADGRSEPGTLAPRLIWALSYWTQALGVLGGLALVAWGAWHGRERVVVSSVRNQTMPAIHLGFALGVVVAVLLWLVGRRARNEDGEEVPGLSLSGLLIFHAGLVFIAALQGLLPALAAATILTLPLALVLFADPIAGYFEVIAAGEHARVVPSPPWLVQAIGLLFLLALVLGVLIVG